MIRYKKFESATDDILIAVETWFWDQCANEYNYNDRETFRDTITAMSAGEDDVATDICICALAEMGYDEDLVSSDEMRNDIVDRLSELASEVYDDEGFAFDKDEDDSYFENRKRKLESRIARLENIIKSKHIMKNEAVKTLPNGMTANSVSDVLSGFTGVGWNDSKSAVRKLNRMGILDAATNRWYPTTDDVADAIEDCWNDSIGNGRGAAEFFIGNIGGDVRCSLTIYPISGGDSKARNITLKFNWPKNKM